MPSPFPGMDPYLERHWTAVHIQFVAAASASLNRVLPRDLVARSEERLAIESDDELDHAVRAPDVTVFAPGTAPSPEGGARGAVLAPYKLVADVDPVKERYIRIFGSNDEKLVTVIEFVSPTNKVGRGLREYVRKRGELVEAGVHVVEVDLCRQGDWRRLLRPHVCPAEAVTPYRATIRPAGDPSTAYLHPISLREPLPAIIIPLRPGDPEIRLELQPLVRDAYDGGRYGTTIDYTKPCSPPLEGDDATWAKTVLASPRPA